MSEERKKQLMSYYSFSTIHISYDVHSKAARSLDCEIEDLIMDRGGNYLCDMNHAEIPRANEVESINTGYSLVDGTVGIYSV